MEGFITRRAQTQIHLNYDYSEQIERTGDTLSMKSLLRKYIAVDEAAAEGAVVLPEKSSALLKMLQRELLAAPQGLNKEDIDGGGGTRCGKGDSDEGENYDEERRKESGARGRVVTSKEVVWKRTTAVVA